MEKRVVLPKFFSLLTLLIFSFVFVDCQSYSNEVVALNVNNGNSKNYIDSYSLHSSHDNPSKEFRITNSGSTNFYASQDNHLNNDNGFYTDVKQKNDTVWNSNIYSYHRPQEFNVNVQVQLKSYSNPDRQISFGKYCTCPTGLTACSASSPTRNGWACAMSFIIIIASADNVVARNVTKYVTLNNQGQISHEDLKAFQKIFDFTLDNQPNSINIFVNNIGPIIDSTGTIENYNTVTHVDTFVQKLNEVNRKSYSGYGGSYQRQPQQATLIGTVLGTQLTLLYTISCRSNFIGPGCDLACNRSEVNSNSAICVNQRTGFFSLCRWTNKNEVNDCKNCPWGIEKNAYCRDENGGILEANHAGVVSKGFQTATIFLAIMCSILTFCLIVICLYSCFIRPVAKNKGNNLNRTPPGYNTANKNRSTFISHTGDPEATGLTNAGKHSYLAPHSGSTPIPQYISPIINNNLGKTAMRTPIHFALPPPAHLGTGGGSIHDTISYAGSQVPLSISADV